MQDWEKDIIQHNLQKAISCELGFAFSIEELEKSRAGVYSDTSENRHLNRVGQKYGEGKKEETEVEGKSKEDESSEDNLQEYAKQASETTLKNAIKQSLDPKVREAAKQELHRRQKEGQPQKEEGKKIPREEERLKLKKEYEQALEDMDFDKLSELHKKFVENAENAHKGEYEEHLFQYEDTRFTQDLSDKEEEALSTYVSIKYREINKQMREGNLSDENKKTVDTILGAIKKNKTKEEIMVYRGIEGKFDESKSKGFVSTSVDKKVAQQFSGRKKGEVEKITIPKETPAIYMGGAEKEVILLAPDWNKYLKEKEIKKSIIMEQWEKDLKLHNLQKSVDIELGFDTPIEEVIKARSGVYANNEQNRKQGRAGERYGNAIQGGQTQNLEEGEKRKEVKNPFKAFNTFKQC